MTIKRLILLGVMAGALLLAGCEASFQASTADLSDPKLASAVDPETKAPTKLLKQVTPETGVIFATVKFSAAPAGTKVVVAVYFLEGGKRQIASDELTVEGEAWVSLEVSPPASGWPLGKYEVEFLLNGKPAEKLSFTVEAAQAKAAPEPSRAQAPAPPTGGSQAPPTAAAPAPAPPAGGSQAPSKAAAPALKWMGDDKHGFAFRAPADWRQRETKNGGYLVNGPANSQAQRVTIIIQMIDKTPGGLPLMGEMKNLLQQYAKLPSGQILKKGEIAVAGKQSPFFLASYQAKGPDGQTVEYAHTQLGLEHKNYILLISYAAVPAIYKKYLAVFQRMVDTFKFRQQQ
jgi:hypothetical protein